MESKAFISLLSSRIELATTLIGLGVTTADKLRKLWSDHGVSDTDLDVILAEVERRLARRA